MKDEKSSRKHLAEIKKTEAFTNLFKATMNTLNIFKGTEGMNPLMLAAAAGQLETIIQIFEDTNVENQDKNGFTPLLHATKNGHLKTVRYFVNETNADIHAQTTLGETAINLAAEAGYFEIVEFLTMKGADVNHKTNTGKTPLISAAANGHIKIVTFLINNGANKDEEDNDQHTAVAHAVDNGYLEVVRYLIEVAKVKTNIKESDLLSHIAIYCGFLAIVKYLRSNKIAVIDDGKALQVAAQRGHINLLDYFKQEKLDFNQVIDCSTEEQELQLSLLAITIEAKQKKVFEYLLDNGIDINTKFFYKHIPTKRKFSGTTIVWAFNKSTKEDGFISALLQRNPNIEYEGTSNLYCPPLHAAIRDGNEWGAYWLISRKISPTEKNQNGDTPFIFAASHGQIHLMMHLLANGAQREEKNNNGMTPLLAAVKAGHLETVKCLVEIVQVNIAAEDIYGRTAVHLAAEGAHPLIISYLKQHGADINKKQNGDGSTPLISAAILGQINSIKSLLENGCDIEARNSYNTTALIVAARNGHTKIVEILYSAGASLDTRNIYGFTALQRAAANGHNETVTYLLKINANKEVEKDPAYTRYHRYVAYEPEKAMMLKNAKARSQINLQAADGEGNTLLHYAAGFGTVAVLKLLLELVTKENLSAKNKLGQTPLHFASCRGGKECEKIIQLLIEKGADVKSKDSNENTPLHMTLKFNGSLPVVKLLVEAGADVDQKNNDGKSPEDIAKEDNLEEILKFFQEYEQKKLIPPKESDNTAVISQTQSDIKTAELKVDNNNAQVATWPKSPSAATPATTAFFAEEKTETEILSLPDDDIPPLTSGDDEVKESKQEM